MPTPAVNIVNFDGKKLLTRTRKGIPQYKIGGLDGTWHHILWVYHDTDLKPLESLGRESLYALLESNLAR